jgi:hypothetical protein
VAEGGGLLNRYTLSRRIEGSNPSVSASSRGSARPPRTSFPYPAEQCRRFGDMVDRGSIAKAGEANDDGPAGSRGR